MRSFNTRVNHKQLHYLENGEGPVLVLLHGFGEDGTIWQKQMEAFAGYRLLVPDLPGSGQSDLLNDMSLASMAMHLHDWLQQLGVENCIMLGHSMGGYIALAYAERYPQALHGAGLIHSTASADTEEKKENRRKGIEFTNANGAPAFLHTLIPKLYGPVSSKEQPQLLQAHLATAHNFSAAALVSYYEAMLQRPDRTAVLQQSKIPWMILAGQYDGVIPLDDSLAMAKLPRLAYIHVLKQSGHMGMMEEWQEANRHIKQFLQTIEIQQTAP